jgi:hypothetical protein
VLALVMTCPAEVFDQAGRECGQFVASIAPAASPEEATWDDELGEQMSTATGASRLDRQPGPSEV